MPKLQAGPHFDAVAVLQVVGEQETGLQVSTNNPERFRAILYETMRAHPLLRCFIYAWPRTTNRFALLRKQIPGAAQLQEPSDGNL
jgi:hypothetical protein